MPVPLYTYIEGKNFEQTLSKSYGIKVRYGWKHIENLGNIRGAQTHLEVVEHHWEHCEKTPKKHPCALPNHGSIHINYIISKKCEIFYKSLKEKKLCEGKFENHKEKKPYEGKLNNLKEKKLY